MNSPAPCRPEAIDLVVVALSARALARSARRAGLRVLSLDLFADVDTREHAARAVRVATAARGAGLCPRALLSALEQHAPQGTPVVLGAGFEDAPRLMARIDRRWPLCGASPAVVERLKNTFALAALLRQIGARHPAVTAEARAGWLRKRAGASGGAHIRVGGRAGPRRYFQEPVAGEALSALFLADGRQAAIVGFSSQWTDPAPGAPFRYGGAVGPVTVSAKDQTTVERWLNALVAETGLTGLASLDLRVDGDVIVAIEVNPRPGATLDVFDRGATSLLAAHIAACAGRLPRPSTEILGPQAAAVIYAPTDCDVAALARPAWTADWPADEGFVPRGAPVCTALAAAATPEAARALVDARRSRLLTSLGAGCPAARPTRTTVPV